MGPSAATIRERDTTIANTVVVHPYALLIAGLPRIGTVNLDRNLG